MDLDSVNFGPDFKIEEDYIVLGYSSTETETIYKIQLTDKGLLKMNIKDTLKPTPL